MPKYSNPKSQHEIPKTLEPNEINEYSNFLFCNKYFFVGRQILYYKFCTFAKAFLLLDDFESIWCNFQFLDTSEQKKLKKKKKKQK